MTKPVSRPPRPGKPRRPCGVTRGWHYPRTRDEGRAMHISEIAEGGCYANVNQPDYFRRVDLIVKSPTRPGGSVVAWSTDGFQVRRVDGGNGRKTHGKCGITTFAKWATNRIDVSVPK
uniref:Uncharacterized protein n=2 Tax=Burkholderia sp. M701 TaxID=326454 RepID=V5YMW9_9BURK|nr:hypothetical protein [Burkholderia sp. M701]